MNIIQPNSKIFCNDYLLCGHCSKMDAKVMRCARCLSENYCSRSCQQKHWPMHRWACVPPQNVRDPSKSPLKILKLEQVISVPFSQNLESQAINAIKNKKSEKLKKIISQMEKGVETRFEYGGKLLMCAIDQNSIDCAKELLKMGARFEDPKTEYTALFNAAEAGHLEAVILLLKHGANITGEFGPDRETPLSISAYQFCHEFQQFLNEKNLGFSCDHQLLKFEMVGWWSEVSNKVDSLRTRFANEHCIRYATDCLKLFICYKNFSKPSDSIHNRALILNLLLGQHSVTHEIPSLTHENDIATDEEKELEHTHSIEPIFVPTDQFQKLNLSELKQHVDRLNVELSQGKTEATIDWSTYPKFFIAQFGAVHYFQHHFSKKQRADYRSTIHLNQPPPFPAFYFTSSLNPAERQVAREPTMESIKKVTGETFKEIKNSGSAEQYCSKIDRPVTKGYPHYATSDLPSQALSYAFGQKKIEGLTEHRLRQLFQQSGKALHPYPGKLFMTLFTPLQRYQHSAQQAEPPFYEEQLVIPSFEEYTEDYQVRYGISADAYQKYKKAISLSWTHSDSDERDRIKNEIIEKIIDYKEERCVTLASNEAKRRGGYLIFRLSDGKYEINFEQMRNPSKGSAPTHTKMEK